jgi:hypothetical protein
MVKKVAAWRRLNLVGRVAFCGNDVLFEMKCPLIYGM